MNGQLVSPSSLNEFLGPIRARFEELGDPKDEIEYRPQTRQTDLVKACGLYDWWNGGGDRKLLKPPSARYIGYGGAVFGGKTYGLIGLAALCAHAFDGVQMAFFRRTYAEMDGPGSVIHKCYEVLSNSGAKSRDSGKHWYWERTGASFYLRHCEHEKDVYKYQGADIDILMVDEATHFSWTIMDYLFTRNRASCDGIIKPFAVLCSNPGNIGHAWYMKLFDLDDKGEGEGKVTGMERWANAKKARITTNPNEEESKVFFLPAYMEDNPIGMERDPGYDESLKERGKDTYEALRHGLWSVFTGQFFRSFTRASHVITEAEFREVCKPWWITWRAVDRGWRHPFYCLWLTMNPTNRRVYVIRELTGSFVTDQDQARSIAMHTPGRENVAITFAPADFWVKKNVRGVVRSTADEYEEEGIPVAPADMDRVNGWIKISNALENGPDGKPLLQIVNTCAKLIEILPKLSRDENRKEDVKKQDGDDAADCLRYGYTNVEMFWTEGSEETPQDQLPQENEWNQLSRIL